MAFTCHVLLAEDSPLNQDVGKAMLENLGCVVDIAGNGIEALRLAAAARYDLIFMDCQMPHMDGYETTVELRKRERNATPRIPIIALTAHMMGSDREKCLAAGMDDFLSKPFRMKELAGILALWTGQAGTADKIEAGDEPSDENRETRAKYKPAGNHDTCIDSAALENIRSLQKAGSPDMLKRIIQIYLTDSAALIGELQKALAKQDPVAMRKAAHTLKSSSANLGAGKLAGLCRHVEEIARAESVEGTGGLITLIQAEHRNVQEALSREL